MASRVGMGLTLSHPTGNPFLPAPSCQEHQGLSLKLDWSGHSAPLSSPPPKATSLKGSKKL